MIFYQKKKWDGMGNWFWIVIDKQDKK
jgi:hypothetical protein